MASEETTERVLQVFFIKVHLSTHSFTLIWAPMSALASVNFKRLNID